MVHIIDIIKNLTPLEKAVFFKICSSGGLSKPGLLLQLGLKHATLSRVVDLLTEKKLVAYTMKIETTTVGRKPLMLSVNPDAFYYIGVDISRIRVGIILTDANLKKLSYIELEKQEFTSADVIIDKVNSHILDLLVKYNIDKEKVIGIGIGAVGKLDKPNGIILYADHFAHPWNHIPIKEKVQKGTRLRVILENGADAATFAEFLMGAAQNCNQVLFVNIGVGIRCGLVNNGRIIHNINNIDSSYGHVVIEPSGKKCTCGNYGCMVMYSTIKPIVEEYKKLHKLQHLNEAENDIDTIRISRVFDAEKKGDPVARTVLTNAASYMGIGLANIVSILNPEVVVLGGRLIEESAIYYEKTVEIAKSRIFRMEDRNITFTKTHFNREAIALGMCTILFDRYFTTK